MKSNSKRLTPILGVFALLLTFLLFSFFPPSYASSPMLDRQVQASSSIPHPLVFHVINLTSPNAQSKGLFDFSVAISGKLAIVVAPFECVGCFFRFVAHAELIN